MSLSRIILHDEASTPARQNFDMTASSTSLTLIQRVRDGDEIAWSRLVALYAPLVYRWCRTRGVSADDSADIVQTVFQAVLNSLARFRLGVTGTSFRGWLFGLTRNKIGDFYRGLGKRLETVGGEMLAETVAPGPSPANDADAVDSEQEDRILLIRRACDSIRQQFSEHHWKAFWETAVEGRRAPEVASELGISADVVRQAKSRVLKQLRNEFSGLEDFLGQG